MTMSSSPAERPSTIGKAPSRWLVVLAVLTIVAAACSDDEAATPPTGGDTSTAARAAATGDPLLVATDLGEVRGVASAVEGVRAFHAMPYAAEPSGDNRWRPPQPRDPYDGTFDATTPGVACPQDPGATAALFALPPQAEDCLMVSVWSPSDAAALPVMVWFHGGALFSGSGQQTLYVGDDLAANDVVVVTVNFRQGPFGFLATEELAAESDDGSVGNYGLADQQAALGWVQRNIAAFGGDPGNVTIFGESSGGSSVCAHLASPASAGLFAKAIVQSAGCGRLWFSTWMPRDEAFANGAAFLAATSCTNVECLRSRSTEELLAADYSPNWVVDGSRLPAPPLDAIASSAAAPVPVMIGSNATEAALFTTTVTEPTDDELLALFSRDSDRPDELLSLYPRADYPSNLERYRAMRTDVLWSCLPLKVADVRDDDTFVYYFDYTSPTDRFGLGPTHGAELPLLFAHPEGLIGLAPGLTGEDATMSEELQSAWAAFATTGDPGENWAPYAENQQITTLTNEGSQLVDGIRGGRCPAVLELTDVTQ